MKKIITLSLVVLIGLVACKNEKAKEKISSQDKSITADNAFNNLFLDSSALTTFNTEDSSTVNIADRMLSFYNQRNFQFAWFASDGLTEQARSFWNLATYKKDSSLANKSLSKQMRALFAEDSITVTVSDKQIVATELMLTKYFIQYMLKNHTESDFDRQEIESFIPKTKGTAVSIADSFLVKKNTNAEYEAGNLPYKQLKEQLGKYTSIVKKGGWQPIVADKKKYTLNDSGAVITAIKKRLVMTGELDVADSSTVFNDALATAIKAYQTSVGITADGIVTKAVITALNVSAQQRLEQLVINLDRMRWLPESETGNLIVCNIPEFRIHVYDGAKEAFEMNVVVGKEAHSTVIFTGNLKEVVFAPYWNVPSSIVKKEILPKMAKNNNYLASENMEIVSGGNVPTIRQKPGGQNALGKVKFLFPNDFDIYFHDTPSKGLFKQDNRAASHGCIRLEDPTKMANYLLRNDTNWPADKIKEAMNAPTEKYVTLKQSVPVLITYYTAWVNENGILNFRDDIYDHDKTVAAKMFTNSTL